MSLFNTQDVQHLFRNKFVVVLGGSVQRGAYKDLVGLLNQSEHIEQSGLKNKGEKSFMGDKLVSGGIIDGMHNGTNYREVRYYCKLQHHIRFYFVTRCYNEYVDAVLQELAEICNGPDVIIMNSCLWDLTRYGHNGRQQYPKNMRRLFQRMIDLFTPKTMVLWLTAPPVGAKVKGGVFLPHLTHFQETIRYDVAEANFQAHQIACEYDVGVLDLHYYFRGLSELRVKDGIHWNAAGHRKMSYLILSHLSMAWSMPLPLSRMPPPPVVPVRRPLMPMRRPLMPVRRPLMPVQSPNMASAEERYGGPIKPAAYLMPQGSMPAPRRVHVRSGSCDPSLLMGPPMAAVYNGGMGCEERYGYCSYGNMPDNAMTEGMGPPLQWAPYQQASYQPTMGQMARRRAFHPY